MSPFERYFQHHTLFFEPEFTLPVEAIIVIPVFDDEDIFDTLDKIVLGERKEGKVGVLVVVNHGEHCSPEVKARNQRLALALRQYMESWNFPDLTGRVVEAFDLPERLAGVGTARKIGMDAAGVYLYRKGLEKSPVLSLDADTWVEPDYTDKVIRFFREQKVAGVSIAFEHRLEEIAKEQNREAMIRYELYLRYYRRALKYCGHPHYYTCIGSAFAVRAEDYFAQGGMNRRQAGEDFYFLQKLIATGRYAELKSTVVHPSARLSVRTPFGTGQALQQIVEQGGNYPVYHPEAFLDLKKLLDDIPAFYRAEKDTVKRGTQKQVPGVRAFLETLPWEETIREANANSASLKQFVKRFYDGFNAFRVLKYLNFVHPRYYAKTDIEKAVTQAAFIRVQPGSLLQMLEDLRKEDRSE